MEDLKAAQQAASKAQAEGSSKEAEEAKELEALRARVEGMAAEQRRTLEGHVAEITSAFVFVCFLSWECCLVVCVRTWNLPLLLFLSPSLLLVGDSRGPTE